MRLFISTMLLTAGLLLGSTLPASAQSAGGYAWEGEPRTTTVCGFSMSDDRLTPACWTEEYQVPMQLRHPTEVRERHQARERAVEERITAFYTRLAR
jgi:hypothetical protein